MGEANAVPVQRHHACAFCFVERGEGVRFRSEGGADRLKGWAGKGRTDGDGLPSCRGEAADMTGHDLTQAGR